MAYRLPDIVVTTVCTYVTALHNKNKIEYGILIRMQILKMWVCIACKFDLCIQNQICKLHSNLRAKLQICNSQIWYKKTVALKTARELANLRCFACKFGLCGHSTRREIVVCSGWSNILPHYHLPELRYKDSVIYW